MHIDRETLEKTGTVCKIILIRLLTIRDIKKTGLHTGFFYSVIIYYFRCP